MEALAISWVVKRYLHVYPSKPFLIKAEVKSQARSHDRPRITIFDRSYISYYNKHVL
jgi:hypothetical protein